MSFFFQVHYFQQYKNENEKKPIILHKYLKVLELPMLILSIYYRKYVNCRVGYKNHTN